MAHIIDQISLYTIDRLSDERIRILRAIQEIRVAQHGQIDPLDELVRQHNDIIDRIDIEEPNVSPLTDPLEALPMEIWQGMIHSYITEMEEILTLTLVSNSWQQKIVSSPLLWTNIQIDPRHTDMEAKFATFFQLSAGLPLSLSFEVSKEAATVIAPLIKGEGYRIQSISITSYVLITAPEDFDCDILLDILFDNAGPLTALADISFFGILSHAPKAERLLETAGNMRSISGIRASPETFKSMPRLQSINISHPIHEVIPAVCNLDHLESLTIWHRDSHSPQQPIEAGPHSDIRAHERAADSPRRWHSLSLDDDGRGLSWGLVRNASESLQFLSIAISWATLPEFIAISCHMLQLNYLILTLSSSHHEEIQPPSLVPVRAGVKYLGLIVDHSAYQPSVNRLGNMLISWLPGVESLRIDTGVDHIFVTEYLRSLQNLSRLKVEGSGTAFAPVIETALPNVNCIEVKGRSTAFTSFYYPNARYLTLTDSWFYDEHTGIVNRVYETVPLGAGQWSSLITLDVGAQKINWCEISLPSLEKIVFGNMSNYYENTPASLIRDLASHSHIFPSLRHLGMRSIPEWDILLIMLENRNFSVESRSTSITTISLPAFPDSAILRAIVDRLGRKLTDRPSNFDLSLLSMTETYIAHDIMCHLLFLPCDKAYSLAMGQPKKKQPLPTYPPSSDDVLSTWEERCAWWGEKIKHTTTRVSKCDRYRMFTQNDTFVSISPHSFPYLDKASTAESRYLRYNGSVFGDREDTLL